jgi:hypothetical protein
MSKAITALILAMFFMASCALFMPEPDKLEAVGGGGRFVAQNVPGNITRTIKLYWDNDVANIKPIKVNVFGIHSVTDTQSITNTPTITSHHVMELRGVETYTAHITDVYTPGELATPGTGVFLEREFTFTNIKPGQYDVCELSWWDINDTKIYFIFLTADDRTIPTDERGFSCDKTYTEPYYIHLPIITKDAK